MLCSRGIVLAVLQSSLYAVRLVICDLNYKRNRKNASTDVQSVPNNLCAVCVATVEEL